VKESPLYLQCGCWMELEDFHAVLHYKQALYFANQEFSRVHYSILSGTQYHRLIDYSTEAAGNLSIFFVIAMK